MEKLQIDDIVIRYKNVVDLNRKIQKSLTRVASKQVKLKTELKWLKRKEKVLKRFLGFREKNADMRPYATETVNS